jgi:hypothetical protein
MYAKQDFASVVLAVGGRGDQRSAPEYVSPAGKIRKSSNMVIRDPVLHLIALVTLALHLHPSVWIWASVTHSEQQLSTAHQEWFEKQKSNCRPDYLPSSHRN